MRLLALVLPLMIPLHLHAQPPASPAGAGSPPGAAGLPRTERRPVVETLHGEAITDPFRWLEGDEKGGMTPEVAAWTDEQNARTRSVLDTLPGRAALEARLSQLMQMGSISAPQMAGTRYFYSKREGTQNQAVVYVRDAFDGPGRVLIDPNTKDEGGLVTVSWYTPSLDGALLAYGTFRAGDENTTLFLMDVKTGRTLPTTITGKVRGVSWLPDSTGFFYENLADAKDPYSARIRLHIIGTDPAQDPLLYRQYTKDENAALATTWGPFFYTSRDARWGVLGYFTTTSDNDLSIVDLDAWRKAGGAKAEATPAAGLGSLEKLLQPVMVGVKGRSVGPIAGDTLFMHTTNEASNGRVVAVDLRDPSKRRVVIPERKDAVLQGISLAKGRLVATYLRDANTRIELFDLQGSSLGEVELPGIGTAGVAAEEDRTEAFLTFESFNEPDSIYRLDLAAVDAARGRSLWERPEVPVDPSIAEVRQVFFDASDGARVPMFIVHRKGLALNGDNPTILYGYGGFNNSETPFFGPTLFPWIEAGGVYVVANIRGGGEYGDAWHRGGMLGVKQRSFDDFIAAAEWLIANKYTNPKRLGVAGGSNGGLLVGAVVTQRPELFSAALCAVPLLDMLRYQNFLMARYWVPEYGDPANPEHFAFLRKYSPYQNIKAGTKYPAILFTAGENDTRVHPLHARKMAAAMQEATASDPVAKPILLWVDRDSGHGAGKPLRLRVRDAADSRIFFMWQLGMLEQAGGPAGAAAPAPAGAEGEFALHVEGMTCELCADKVRTALGSLPGVLSTDVDVEGKRAVVLLKPGSKPDTQAMVAALAKVKFTAKPE